MERFPNFAQPDPAGRYTYADCLGWEIEQYDLIGGRLLPPMPGRSPAHQRCLMGLMQQVQTFLKQQPRPRPQVYHLPLDVRLPPWPGAANDEIVDVVQPDLLVVCDPAGLDERGASGPPDWLVEVVSPGFVDRDIRLKFAFYQRHGVREYWLVFPYAKAVAAYRLDADGRYQLAAEYAAPGPMLVATLPGLVLEWSQIFTGI